MKGRTYYWKKAKSRKMGRERSGGVMRKLVWCGKRSFSHQSSESESESESDSVREGYVRVVVGKVGSEVVFYEMDTIYLNHPLLVKLLSLTGEEYGYSYEGALRIACDIHLFRYLIQLLSTGNPCAHYMDLPDLVSKFNFHSEQHQVKWGFIWTLQNNCFDDYLGYFSHLVRILFIILLYGKVDLSEYKHCSKTTPRENLVCYR